jgi:hypothetical protein
MHLSGASLFLVQMLVRSIVVVVSTVVVAIIFARIETGRFGGVRNALKEFSIDSWMKFLALCCVWTAAEGFSSYLLKLN